MRTISVLRRVLATLGITAVVGGAVVAGSAAPALAEPDLTVRLTAECGAAVLTFGEATPGLPGVLNVTVHRNGVGAESTVVDQGGTKRYGASDGDTFTVHLPGGRPAQSLRYAAPAGCDTPKLQVAVLQDCYGIEVRVINTGAVPATGLKVASPVGPLLVELDPVTSDAMFRRHYPLPDDAPYAVFSGEVDGGALWASGRYRQPQGCGPESVTARFTDRCGEVRIDLTNRARGGVRLEVLVGGAVVASPSIPADSSDTVAVPASSGDRVVVRDAVLGTEIARHTAGRCPSATPSPGGDGSPSATPSPGGDEEPSATPSPDEDASPSVTPSPSGAAGGLPLTGGPVLRLLGAAVLIVAAGVALLLIARRRGTFAR
ncbi:hypothetical protein GCM10011608_23520 [Micromonospora sonchi]|uniref:Uncharacterized protein n=1 Tax=Micromonospora sonchi TaxID=1763543 RepID=A0A917TU07_9ACTN|nr:hypothetical protein [Micromonospora sonchi]GGM38155.1 hypothetical protein GCM10011608_23520 [Micromonospora sonchi]